MKLILSLLFVITLLKPLSLVAKDEYFVVLKEPPASPQNKALSIKQKRKLRTLKQKVKSLGGKTFTEYSLIFLGSHVQLSKQAFRSLRKHPLVETIAANSKAYLSDNSTITKSWGLDRVDQYSKDLNGRYTTFSTGAGAHVYVMDTGVRASHSEFKGRVKEGYSALPDPSMPYFSPYDDCHGHGTHVSGTALGTTSGLARQAFLHPVKIFGCRGSTTFDIILKGYEWILANHKKPAVVNMSFGGAKNEASNIAVANMIKAGIHTVIAAGNSNDDACKYSPASTPEAITVAATNSKDERVTPGFWGSNWGTCVDIFAPGENIISAGKKSDQNFAQMSGTSMAAPHVTGAVALVLGLYPNKTPGELTQYIIDRALSGKIGKVNGSQNKFLVVSRITEHPFAFAGKDQFLVIPKQAIYLTGIAKDFNEGLSYSNWTQLSGPKIKSTYSLDSVWRQSLVLHEPVEGEYLFRFEAVDQSGNISSDDVKINLFKNNVPPIALADEHGITSFSTFSLVGSQSIDPDGEIVSWDWKQVSGPKKLTLVKGVDKSRTNTKGAIPGDYRFELTVTDNESATGSTFMDYRVNIRPFVVLDKKKTIFWPDNSTTLTAKVKEDQDGKVLWHYWKQYGEKPSKVKILSEDNLTTKIEGLQVGEYEIVFSAVDDSGSITREDIIIEVVDNRTL